MIEHGPTCLSGPISKERDWWEAAILETPANSDLLELDGIRLDLVLRVRAEIADGTYDTDEKLDIAMERLIDRLEQD